MKKHCRHKFILFLGFSAAALLNGALSPIYAQQSTPTLQTARQVSTHPASDLAPRLSPDGEWLAYASNQSGNYDIWIKNLESGRTRQITTHQSDDFYPVWDKKGRYLIFVSQRSDAKGDIYRINLRSVIGELIVKGEPERLTTYMGFDGYPTISEYDEHIAWVTDRTGRPEIWLQTERREDVRQLTHGGATHPSWSPKQDYLAFTSFRDDSSNGDIWIINLYAARELFDVKAPTDSLERPMWPVTRGPAVDGFPTWSPDAKSIIFARADLDTDGDSRLSPADRTALWAVDIRHTPGDSTQKSNAAYELFRDSFNTRIATAARPLTSTHLEAIQPELGVDGSLWYTSNVKGNYDVWALQKFAYHTLTDSVITVEAIDDIFPLPDNLQSEELSRILFHAAKNDISQDEAVVLQQRIAALHTVVDNMTFNDDPMWSAMYEIGICYFLLGHRSRANLYFSYLTSKSPDAESAAWAETLSFMINSIDASTALENQLHALVDDILLVQSNHPDNHHFLAKSTLLLGDIQRSLDAQMAAANYKRICREYEEFSDICAHSQYNLGLLFVEQGQYKEAFQTFLNVLQHHYAQTEWAVKARDELINLFIRDTNSTSETITRYQTLHAQFRQFDLIAVDPLMRAAALMVEEKNFDDAASLYDYIIAQYPHLHQQNFEAKMARIDLYVAKGEIIQAAKELEKLREENAQTNAEFLQDATDKLVALLLVSADELAASENYELAAARYKSVLPLASRNLHAHQGYIRSLTALGKVDKALREYSVELEMHPNNNVLHYTIGLCYSYKGAQVIDGQVDPSKVNDNFLKLSNEMLQQALAFDYNLIDAYLTLSFNYEMLENHQRWEKAEPKNFWKKAGGTITSPIVWLYRTATFYNETKAPRYYELAIEELTKALALNDEEKQPKLESMLARNMANNYYNLGEFGFNKAYEFYHLSLNYDSTFVDEHDEAMVYERMGHCAMFVNDQENGPRYFKRAIEIFKKHNKPNKVLLNTKRLALLYEIGENSADALTFYEQAADMEESRDFYDGLLRSYRSIAYHNFVLQNPQQAAAYADRALALMDSGKVTRSYGEPIYVQLGILGLYAPFPYDLRKLGVKSAFQLSTDEEEAFIYTIFSRNYLNDEEYDRAIEYIEKKFKIYDQRHDYDALAIFQNNMGHIYYTKGDYDLAWRWFTNAYWMCKKTKYRGGQLLNITNAAYVVLTIANDPDPARHEHVLKYYNWITNKIRELLKLTADDELAYAFYHTQLNLLLSELTMIDPEHLHENQSIERTTRILSRAVEAEAILQRALDLSKRYNYYLEQASIHYRLGKLNSLLGEHDRALAEFRQSRNMAAQHGIPELLWQAVTAVGSAIEQLQADGRTDLRDDPLELYQQAIQISETNRIKHHGITASRMRELYSEPYSKAAERLVALGRYAKALQTIERLRERTFFESIEQQKIRFFSDRRQILFQQADSLQKEIQKLDLLNLQTSETSTVNQKEKADGDLDLYEQFDKTLNEIKTEAPEIESLVKITPTSVRAVQKLLAGHSVVFMHTADNGVHLWIISADSVTYKNVNFEGSSIQSALGAAVTKIRDNTTNSLPPVVQNLFATINGTVQTQDYILLPDSEYLLYPWTALSEAADAAGPRLQSVSSSLTNLYHSLLAAKLQRGRTIFVAGDSAAVSPLKLAGFSRQQTIAGETGDTFNAQRPALAETDVLHIAVNTDWNDVQPGQSNFQFSVGPAQAKIQAQDLYGLKTSTAFLANLDVRHRTLLNARPEPLIFWERALAYTGIPALMMPLWTTNDSTQIYYNSFYKELAQNELPKAKFKADSTCKHMFQGNADFAAHQIFGAAFSVTPKTEGQTPQTSHLIVEAQEAFQDRRWNDAIQLCRQALSGNNYDNDLNQILIHAAINAQNWDAAIQAQRNATAKLLRQDRFNQAVDAYSLLALLYESAGDRKTATATKKKIVDLKQKYGLAGDLIAAYQQTARILQKGENIKRAVQSLKYAADLYAAASMKDKQCRVLIDAAGMLTGDLSDPVAALELLDKAIDLDLHMENNKLRIEALLKKADIYSSLDLLSRAYETTMKADSLCADSLQQQALINLAQAEILFEKRELYVAQQLGNQTKLRPDLNNGLKIKLLCLDSKIAAERGALISALSLAQSALKSARETGDMHLVNIARRTNAIVLWRQKNFSQASTQLQELLRSGILSDSEQLRINLLLGAVMTDAGDFPGAQLHLETALKIAEQKEDVRSIAIAHMLTAHNPASNQDHLNSAIKIAESLHFYDIAWHVHFILAQRMAVQDQHLDAMQSFEKAVQLLQKVKMGTQWRSYNNALSTGADDFFKVFINYLIEQQYYERALQVYEQQKGFDYIQLVSDRILAPTPERKKIIATLDSLQSIFFLTRAQQSAQWSQKNESDASSRLASISSAIHLFEKKLAIEEPVIHNQHFTQQIDLNALQRSLNDSIGIFVFRESIGKMGVWKVTANDVVFKEHEFDKNNFNKALRRLDESLQQKQPLAHFSQELSAMLLSPWQNDFASLAKLVFITDDVTNDVSWTVLQTDSLGYFGLHFDISVAQRLEHCLKKSRAPFSSQSVAAIICSADELNETLPYAQNVGESLARYFKTLKNTAAGSSMKDRLQTSLHGDVLYFGCRLATNADFPFQSHIGLPQSTKRLDCRDILSMQWDTGLAAIYALNGNSNESPLKSCLLNSGVNGLIVPQWPAVDDHASAVLLKRFFRNIAGGQSPDRALRNARRTVHDHIDKHPAYWGGVQFEGALFTPEP